MSSSKGIIADSHADYNTAENSFYPLPSVKDKIDIISLGDDHGPKKDKDFLRKMGRHKEDYFENLYNYPLKGEEERKEAEQFGLAAHNDTKNLITVFEEHPKIKLEAKISGNGEQIYQKYIPYFADVESPRDLFANSSLNFVEMPDVYFYKDGKRVSDEKDVDTAILLLPYIQPRDYYNKIQKIFGEKISEKDFVKEALKMLSEDNGILDRIKKANPKYIFQLQHEQPSKEIFEPFGMAREAENKEIYEAVMEALSEYVEGTGKNYVIMFGHIEKGGRFKQTITYKGRNIKTIHVKEGGDDILLFDVKTGKIYEQGEIPDINDGEKLSETTIEDMMGESEEEVSEEAAESEAEAVEASE